MITLFLCLLSFSLLIFTINAYAHYGNVKRWHSTSLIPLIGGFWAFICACVFLPPPYKWMSPLFFLFDLSVLMLIVSVFDKQWNDVRDSFVKEIVHNLINGQWGNIKGFSSDMARILQESETRYGSQLSLPPDHALTHNGYFYEDTWKEFSGVEHSVVGVKMWFGGIERKCVVKIHVEKDGAKISAWIEGVEI